MGKDWLYFSPKWLDIQVEEETLLKDFQNKKQQWVKLNNFAWALDPERLWALIHGMMGRKTWAMEKRRLAEEDHRGHNRLRCCVAFLLSQHRQQLVILHAIADCVQAD